VRQKSAFFRCTRGVRKTKKNRNSAPGRRFPREIASRGAHFAHTGGFPRETAPGRPPRGAPAPDPGFPPWAPGSGISRPQGARSGISRPQGARSGNSRIRLPDPGIPGSGSQIRDFPTPGRQIREFPDPSARSGNSCSEEPIPAPEPLIPAQKGCFDPRRVVIPKTLFWEAKCLKRTFRAGGPISLGKLSEALNENAVFSKTRTK